MGIELHHSRAFPFPDIADRDADTDFPVFLDGFAVGGRFPELEVRVAQTISERELRFYVHLVEPAVAHIYPFAVDYLAGIVRVIEAEMVHRVVVERLRNRERKPSGRVFLAEKHVCNRVSALASAVPAVEYGFGGVSPRHRD